MVNQRRYLIKCGSRVQGGADCVDLRMGRSKSGDPGTFSENVLILGMARVRSGDLMYRSGFVSNPVNKTLS